MIRFLHLNLLIFSNICVYGYFPGNGEAAYNHKNVSVQQCIAYNNTGNPTYTENHTGDGIILGMVDGGEIIESVAYNNGYDKKY